MNTLSVDNFKAQLDAAVTEFDHIYVVWSGDEFCVITETDHYSRRAASWWYGVDDIDEEQTAREFIVNASEHSLGAWRRLEACDGRMTAEVRGEDIHVAIDGVDVAGVIFETGVESDPCVAVWDAEGEVIGDSIVLNEHGHNFPPHPLDEGESQ